MQHVLGVRPAGGKRHEQWTQDTIGQVCKQLNGREGRHPYTKSLWKILLKFKILMWLTSESKLLIKEMQQIGIG